MKKQLLLLSLLLGVSTGLFSQIYVVAWDGDMRYGCSVGAMMTFHDTKFETFRYYLSKEQGDFLIDCGQSILKQKSFKYKGFSPSISFYGGNRKELRNNKFGFGRDYFLTFFKSGFDAEFEDDFAKVSISKDYAYMMMQEHMMLSYLLTDKLYLSAGLGLSQVISFAYKKDVKTERKTNTILIPDELGTDTDVDIDLMLGVSFSLGATYEFNETFFAGANLNCMALPIFSMASLSSGSEWNFDYGTNGIECLAGKPTFGGLSFTFGFRW